MFHELQTRLYPLLRESAGLTQIELAIASGLSRRNLQRIETGDKVPTREEDEAIRVATESTRLSVAELICKVLSELIRRQVTIGSEETGYRAATPEAELDELLRAASEKMPRDQWWAWRERVGRFRQLGQLYEAQGFAEVRDLTAEIEALPKTENAEETAAEESKPPGQEDG